MSTGAVYTSTKRQRTPEDLGMVLKLPKSWQPRTLLIPHVPFWEAMEKEHDGLAADDFRFVGFVRDPERRGQTTEPKCWNPYSARHRFAKMMRKVGPHRQRQGSPYTLHSLRHYVATILYNQTHDWVKVAKFLGHKTPAITMRLYANHVVDDSQRRFGEIAAAPWWGSGDAPRRRRRVTRPVPATIMTTVRGEADVVVVGAGIAGLVAARELARAGRDVVVLEARDRVGGRLLNHHLGEGKVVEIGGQWIGPTQDRIESLAAELGIETFTTYTEGDNLIVLGGKTTRFTGEDPPFETETLHGMAGAIVSLQKMADEIPIDEPWTAPRAAEWDAQTFHTFIEDNVKDDDARAMFELLSGAVFTASADELSLLHVLIYIRSAGSLSPLLTDVIGGAQERRFAGGSQAICERMADELGTRIVLAAPVREITQDERVTVRTAAKEVVAQCCIVAVPPTVADRITFRPALPADRAQLQRRMAAGSVIKCNAIYDEPFWRRDGLSGRVIDPAGPLTITFDNSPPDGTPGILMGFIEADEARRLGRISSDERRSIVLDCLARHFGPKAKTPIDYVDRNWDDEEWTRGCYGANLPPGAWTRYGHALREPIGRIHWASAETGTRWLNYMDGAVESGTRAAAEILDRSR